MKKLWIALLIAALLAASPVSCAHAETEQDIWTLVTQEGQRLTQIAAPVAVGDEYIAQDNRTYRVTAVDESTHKATVQETGQEAAVTQAFYPAVRVLAVLHALGRILRKRGRRVLTGDGLGGHPRRGGDAQELAGGQGRDGGVQHGLLPAARRGGLPSLARGGDGTGQERPCGYL